MLVNNTRVQEFRLYDGDLIQIGHVKLRLFDPTETSPRESDRSAGSSPLSRSTPSRSVAVARRSVAPRACFARARRARARRTAVARVRAAARAHRRVRRVPSELHPAVAGQLAAEGTGYRQRRPSVRVRIQADLGEVETSSATRS